VQPDQGVFLCITNYGGGAGPAQGGNPATRSWLLQSLQSMLAGGEVN